MTLEVPEENSGKFGFSELRESINGREDPLYKIFFLRFWIVTESCKQNQAINDIPCIKYLYFLSKREV